MNKVIVTWNDHWYDQDKNSSYTSETIDSVAKPYQRRTIGFLAHENEDVIVLAGTIDESSFCDIFVLLKPDIESIIHVS